MVMIIIIIIIILCIYNAPNDALSANKICYTLKTITIHIQDTKSYQIYHT